MDAMSDGRPCWVARMFLAEVLTSSSKKDSVMDDGVCTPAISVRCHFPFLWEGGTSVAGRLRGHVEGTDLFGQRFTALQGSALIDALPRAARPFLGCLPWAI